MTQRHAFVVFAGAGEAGRVFHALTYATQAHNRGDQAAIYFAGEGTCWPAMLASTDHAMHSLFSALHDDGIIKGACENCANAFGNTDGLIGLCTLIKGPEESFGQIDVLGLEDSGWRVWLL